MNALLETELRPANEYAPTPHRVLDELVIRLREGAAAFVRLTIADRIALAQSMREGYARLAERQVHAACAAKGIRRGTPTEGEEWALGPWAVIRHLRLTIASLDALARHGNTPIGPLGATADGRVTVGLMPANAVDRLLFTGSSLDVHMQAGLDARAVDARRARFYREAPHDGRTVLVLGAGNVAAIPAMDVITMLFNEGKVCLLKMNPVNAYLGPILEAAFASAVARGFLAVAYGGAAEGGYLAEHPGIDEIHLTGSEHTYDAIVWGAPGAEREDRKRRHAPRITKPITAELGNISPILVVPGPYSDRQLAFQAETIAASVTYNASFNCNAGKMLLSPRGWTGRDRLLAAIKRVLTATPTRRAYYPGAADRWRRLTHGRPSRWTTGEVADGTLPWTLLPDLDAADRDEPAFVTEPFCAILSETQVASADPIEYLERAVDFANQHVWGTLAASLIVHPRLLRDRTIAAAVERAIARLRYGAVAVNTWAGWIFPLGSPPWGAHPSSTPEDIQSGAGWVHNASMLDGIEKAVLRAPLTTFPKPAIFPSHRTAHLATQRLVHFEADTKLRHLPGIVAAAIRG